MINLYLTSEEMRVFVLHFLQLWILIFSIGRYIIFILILADDLGYNELGS
tara:strand:+ start:1071 stop:1220 length:150 start_codon:yes stop_codon:yes gene_type:complete